MMTATPPRIRSRTIGFSNVDGTEGVPIELGADETTLTAREVIARNGAEFDKDTMHVNVGGECVGLETPVRPGEVVSLTANVSMG